MEAGTTRREGQEGSRWVNQRPTGEEVATWFRENVALHHEDLQHDDYISGLTLIQQEAEEKEVVGWQDSGAPLIEKRKNLYYVPYAKVETRVKYFWDLVRLHEDWLGVIEAVPPVEPIKSLPPGFGKLAIATGDSRAVVFVTYSARALIYERDTVEMKPIVNRQTGETRFERHGRLVMAGAPGTKMVATLGRYGPDNFSLMKAETGAVGRALGLLGMLVVPGSGVATAEDMQEAIAAEGGPTQTAPQQAAEGGEQAALTDDDDALRRRVTALIGDLQKLDEKRVAGFRTWVRDDRKIASLADATSPQLRGLVSKLEKEIAEANDAEQAAEG